MNCYGKAGGETPESIEPSRWGGTAKPARPARKEGTAGPKEFTDAKSDSWKDGLSVLSPHSRSRGGWVPFPRVGSRVMG